jgi:hypothetical protein
VGPIYFAAFKAGICIIRAVSFDGSDKFVIAIRRPDMAAAPRAGLG